MSIKLLSTKSIDTAGNKPGKIYVFLVAFSLITPVAYSQLSNKLITGKEARRIEMILSSDAMKGRGPGTPGIDKAADFISKKFKAMGLKTFNNAPGYKQAFAFVKPKLTSQSATIDGQVFDNKNVIVLTSSPELMVNEQSGYKRIFIKAGASFGREIQGILSKNESLLVIIDNTFSKNFPRLQSLKRGVF